MYKWSCFSVEWNKTSRIFPSWLCWLQKVSRDLLIIPRKNHNYQWLNFVQTTHELLSTNIFDIVNNYEFFLDREFWSLFSPSPSGGIPFI
jgi:hypothetical protein